MIATISVPYRLRDKIISYSFTYPRWTEEIEQVMVREFEAIKDRPEFKLTLTISKNSC